MPLAEPRPSGSDIPSKITCEISTSDATVISLMLNAPWNYKAIAMSAMKLETTIILRTCILILSMKNYTLKLIGKVHNLSLVARRFDTLQQGESSVVGSVANNRHSFIDLRFVEFFHAQVFILIHYIVAALFRFRFGPTSLDRCACAFTSLCRCQFSGSSCNAVHLAPKV